MYISQEPSHKPDSNRSLFDHAWGRVRNYTPGMDEWGVGLNEARYWHRRVYGGYNNGEPLSPSEIGHAAAYEAYRTWIHNTSIYEPLSGDLERQREGLIGLAVAEAARLAQQPVITRRPMDSYARMEVSDAAAATASVIFYESRDEMELDRARPRSRMGSFSGSSVGDPYAMDDRLLYPRRYGRSRSRHRSLSRPGGSPTIINVPPVGGMGPGMPYPSAPGSAYGMPAAGYPGSAGPYGGGGYSSPYPSPENATMQYGVGGFAGSSLGAGPGYPPGNYPPGSYPPGGYPAGGYPAPGYGGMMMNPSAGYGQQPYMMQQPMMGQPQAGTTVILQPSRRKHRHRRRSRGSSDGYASDYR
ncbi:hypothetical protein ONZ45_g13207 [Pleurotus djamor]|nr:hypothetical protein ONZ45_g13207 [Pleurotus djamor]